MSLFFCQLLRCPWKELDNWTLSKNFSTPSGLNPGPAACQLSTTELQFNLLTLVLIFILRQSSAQIGLELTVLPQSPEFWIHLQTCATKPFLLDFGYWNYWSVLVTPGTRTKPWICRGLKETNILFIANLLWRLVPLPCSYSHMEQMKLVS